MKIRNLSAQRMFTAWGRAHRPQHQFTGKTKADFLRWKKVTLPKVLACLGDFPKRVPLNAEPIAEWDHDGVHKQKWFIDVLPHLSVVVQVNRPPNLKRGEKRPALLCWHGHGSFGKESVMGNDSSPERRDDIQRLNYNYGHQMAQQGFVTFAVDWMGMGDLKEDRSPNWQSQAGNRDWCNLYYLHATMLGLTSISINVTLGKAATDFVSALPYVDKNRLGVMGLSGGGTMTLWSTLCDSRFKASEIICYSQLWQGFGLRDINYCGMQVAPGLFKLVDLPDAQGLIAPRPLLVDAGIYDSGFRVEDALACYRQVERIYRAAGLADKLELDLFPGEHAWGGNKSVAFFRKHL